MPSPRMRRLFLHAGGLADSALADSAAHLNGAKNIVFLPYASHNHDAATARMQSRMFDALGLTLTGLHTFNDPVRAIETAGAVVGGGGNSFRLVKALHELRLVEPLRRAINAGVPYWGVSAGSNIACPSIRTTNDMPIVQPPSFAALDLVPFQINPHFVDAPPPELQAGETREDRLREFLEENDVVVVGLREDSWIIVHGDSAKLHGSADALLFRRGRPPEPIVSGSDISFLLTESARFDDPVSSAIVRHWS